MTRRSTERLSTERRRHLRLPGPPAKRPLPALAEMILAARETLGGHTNSGLLPRALAELILAARSNKKSVLHRLHIRPILHILPNV